MRWIALLLAIANLGFFGWVYFIGDMQVPKAVSRSPVHPQGVATIKLVREVGGTLRFPAADLPAAAGQMCAMLGPFAQEFQGEDVVQRLRALQVGARLREVEVQGQMRSWVYLPPLRSRSEANRKLRELQAANVDSYVIPKGPLANGISFGIFSERERAEVLAQQLRDRGFVVKLHREPRVYVERWVVVPAGTHAHLAADFWAQLQREYPKVMWRKKPCKQIG